MHGCRKWRGQEGRIPLRSLDLPKQLCYFWNNVTLLWVPSLLELGLVLGKITLVLVGVNTHGQSSHQVLDRRSPNYPQLSDHYLNCTTEKDLTRRPEWTLFEQAVFSQLISTTILKFRQVKFHMWYPLDRRFHPSMVCKTSTIIRPLSTLIVQQERTSLGAQNERFLSRQTCSLH